jgi:hypothetical protein
MSKLFPTLLIILDLIAGLGYAFKISVKVPQSFDGTVKVVLLAGGLFVAISTYFVLSELNVTFDPQWKKIIYWIAAATLTAMVTF